MLITVETLVRAPVAAVWKAWTTPEDIVQWNSASPDWHTTRASVDLRVGGQFSSRMEAKDGSMGFDFAGEYTEVVEHQLLVAVFGDRSLRVEFIPEEAGVTVRETFEAETTFPPEQQRQGWQAILSNFARHVEAQH
ncbi:MAG TPA: SRPBCC family protein [Burkholderiaceae bacterium]|nr:SRPBCC family protein [Burkholderiaceae bacterium]HNG82472.1 SRPBCC family protein [Burkholderiaceae bacterium]